MDIKDHGGPAFPISSPSGAPEYMSARDGMTLRDWFAGQALPQAIALVSSPDGASEVVKLANREGTDKGVATVVVVAQMAYGFADAMLAARKVKR